MPVVANVLIASGRDHLANWSSKRGVNHSITIIGDDDTQGTYTVPQATMVALLAAETDQDGLIW